MKKIAENTAAESLSFCHHQLEIPGFVFRSYAGIVTRTSSRGRLKFSAMLGLNAEALLASFAFPDLRDESGAHVVGHCLAAFAYLSRLGAKAMQASYYCSSQIILKNVLERCLKVDECMNV